jgi:hypothetical protein
VADNAYPLPHEVPAWPSEQKSCININGVPGYFVENITFSGIHLTFPGGGTQEDAHRAVPELRDHYPEYHMFGVLPAYGMYIRHAKGITLENVTFETAELDLRPALVCEDVEDLELANFRAVGAIGDELLRLCDTRQAYIHGCRPLGQSGLFLGLEGSGSRDIFLQANDLRRSAQAIAVADGAPADAVIMQG